MIQEPMTVAVEVQPPRYNLYCGARVMQGPSRWNVFYLSFVITALFIVYLALMAPPLWTLVSPALPLITVLLFLFCFGALQMAAFTDPGMLPRRPASEEDDSLSPFKISIAVNGIDVDCKFCQTCNMYRPPRSNHCGVCNNCIERFDHHCPYLSTCIGKRNYRFFLSFIFSAFTLGVYIVIQSAVLIATYARVFSLSFGEALAATPTSAFMFVTCLMGLIGLGVLVNFHILLLFKQLTTNELLSRRYTKNPYKSSCGAELRAICCAPLSSSWPRVWYQLTNEQTMEKAMPAISTELSMDSISDQV